MPKITILSLGGSLIAPSGIDTGFLKNFKETIEKYIKKDYKFVIYCGGGKLARKIQQAASQIAKPSNNDLDWIGIFATKLNAQLVRTIFKSNAEDFIVDNPTQKVRFEKSILVAGGWLPGWSTDYDAVLLAKSLGIREIVNISNIDYVYDKDPRKYKNAKKIEKIKWPELIKLTSPKWRAGMNVPFDPVAAREAQKSKIKVFIIGKDLKNFESLLNGRNFKGTIID